MQPGEGEGIERDSAETERRRRRRRENQGAPLSPPALLPLTHVGFELEDFVDADLNCGFRGIDVGKLVDFFFFFISIGFVEEGGLANLKSAKSRFSIFVKVDRFWVGFVLVCARLEEVNI